MYWLRRSRACCRRRTEICAVVDESELVVVHEPESIVVDESELAVVDEPERAIVDELECAVVGKPESFVVNEPVSAVLEVLEPYHQEGKSSKAEQNDEDE